MNKKGKEKTVTSDKFIIATGGRPKYPDIPGRVVLACHTNVDGNSWFLGKTFFFIRWSLYCAFINRKKHNKMLEKDKSESLRLVPKSFYHNDS